MTKKLQSITNKTAPVIAVAVIILIWYLCCDAEVVPAYMLPSPTKVITAFINNFDVMMKQAAVTLQETLYGLLIGIASAFVIAVIMDRFKWLYKAIYPILVVTRPYPLLQ